MTIGPWPLKSHFKSAEYCIWPVYIDELQSAWGNDNVHRDTTIIKLASYQHVCLFQIIWQFQQSHPPNLFLVPCKLSTQIINFLENTAQFFCVNNYINNKNKKIISKVNISQVMTAFDRAEKRQRMRAVDSFWRVFCRLINESLPPWRTLFLHMISWQLPLLTRWNLTNFENNPIQPEVSDIPNTSLRWVVSCTKTTFSEVHPLSFLKNNFPLL